MERYTLLLVDDEEEVVQIIMKQDFLGRNRIFCNRTCE